MLGEAADLRHSCEHRRALTISEGGSKGANRPNTARPRRDTPRPLIIKLQQINYHNHLPTAN